MVLYHVGYAWRTANALVQQLRNARVGELVDMRLTAGSKKLGLSKTKLACALESVGIRYRHDKLLGNLRDNRHAFPESVSSKIHGHRWEAKDRSWLPYDNLPEFTIREKYRAARDYMSVDRCRPIASFL